MKRFNYLATLTVVTPILFLLALVILICTVFCRGLAWLIDQGASFVGELDPSAGRADG